MRLLIKILLLIFFTFLKQLTFAQVCTGTLGNPVIGAGTDFGRGEAPIGNAIPNNTNYKYTDGLPNDGEYTIAKTNANVFRGAWWKGFGDHTNYEDGYVMIVNANYEKGIFYQTDVNNLCPNVTYEFSAYILNLLTFDGIDPNVRFTIKNNGVIIQDVKTENIPEESAAKWVKYGTSFITPPDVGTITLTMTNENPGGLGNDLALDDITFRPCGPTLTPLIANTTLNAKLCEHETAEIDLNVNVTAGYTNPVYQWQIKNGNDWIDLPGETNTKTTIKFVNAVEGTYMYHLLVAEQGNIASANCRIVSDPLTITVMTSPKAIASSNGPVCIGTDIQLNVNDGNSFTWTGPNNFTSTEQNPIIRNTTVDMSGDYTVTATNANGCASSSTVNVQVKKIEPKINASQTNICKGSSVNLEASGGTTYSWLPTDGLSDPSSAKTTASPDQTTTYTVTISNGICAETAQVTVNVVDKVQPSTNISSTTICKGSSVSLEASGGTTYSWLPTDGLSDPNSANTTASPNETTTYTVTISNGICSETAQVTVNVVDKVQPSTNISSTTICKGSGVNLEASGGTTYAWLPTDGLSDPNSAKTTASPDKTTTYTVTISNGSCSETAQVTVNVVDKVQPSTNISSTTICKGSSVSLEASGGTTYSWLPNDGLSDPNSANTTASPDQTTTYIVTISNGICSETAQVTVNVVDKVQPSTNISSTTICKGSGVNLEASGGTTYAWLPTDGLSDPNSAKTTASPDKTTTYTVTISNGSCSETAQVTVNVVDKVQPSTNISSTTICKGSSVSLEASGGTTYSWLPTDGLSDPSSAKTTASPNETTTYTVTISNGICSETAQVTLNVDDKVVPSTNISTTTICKGSSVSLEASGGTTYSWLPIDGLSDPSSAKTTASPDKTTTYTITISNGSCFETAQVTVNVVDKVQPSTNISSVTVCQGNSVILEASGGTTYSWMPTDGLSDPSSAKTTASPDETTTYTVTISNGICSETAQVTVNVNKNATADAGEDQIILNGQSTTLKGKVAGNDVAYYWTPSDYLDDPNKLNPEANPPKDITYTLHARSNSGCISSVDDVFIKVFTEIKIPKSFSPNGDAINDTWDIPVSDAFTNPKVKIINRYGQLVYQSTGKFKPWDGKSDGKDLPSGLYLYSVYFSAGSKPYTGWIMLIR
ncbi:gliding motility-associated C-terminal domain-containing protein [Pedobacter yonginense]|nr:gliding motility-associated C-terminal domain-containing protein [Pedobacter yonginense]